MPEALKGFAARFYAVAFDRILLLREFHTRVANDISKRLSSGTVLDVGTGPGYLPIKIAARNPAFEVIGLDLSQDMIRIAHARRGKVNAEGVELLVGDAAEIGIRNESVDLAVATLSFHHWTKPSRALEELFRILKVGGEVWIYEIDRNLTPQSEDWMKKNYSTVAGRVARLVMRVVSGHTFTVEQAREILNSQKSRLVYSKVEQLEPMLIKITLSKK